MLAKKQAPSPIGVSENFAVGIALVLLSFRLCLMPIGSGLSLDETGTFWIIQGSLPQILARSLSLSPQSALYMAIVWMCRFPRDLVSSGGNHGGPRHLRRSA
jgi:hypothetical protein